MHSKNRLEIGDLVLLVPEIWRDRVVGWPTLEDIEKYNDAVINIPKKTFGMITRRNEGKFRNYYQVLVSGIGTSWLYYETLVPIDAPQEPHTQISGW